MKKLLPPLALVATIAALTGQLLAQAAAPTGQSVQTAGTGTSVSQSGNVVVASNPRGTVLLTGGYAQQAFAGAALIIPGKDTTSEQMAALNEDMQVMCRILDRNLGPANWSGRQLLYFQFLTQYRDETTQSLIAPSPATRSIYVDGYGVLFLVTVDFPLSASTQEPKQQDSTDAAQDPVWQQVHDDIYNPQPRRDRDDQTTPEYDPETVAQLTDSAIKSLKHAANIRGLAPTAFVTLIIRSGDADSAVKISSRGSNSSARVLPSTGTQAAPVTTMVLRARKRDIDAFAAGQADYQAFRQKVDLAKY